MAESTVNPASIQPLRSIALTFSGGGYRAAAYALGVLSYLNRISLGGKPLLSNVKALSTVSGGTITGAYYAVRAGGTFRQFYDGLYAFLKEDKLMDHALRKLEDSKHWKTNHKKQSLINAFAESYRELLVTETFRDLEKTSSHLEDIIFNASEFNNADVFRFQTQGRFGNGHTYCAELNAAKSSILIADAIAASSCFPLGFEPIVFPDDFMPHDSDIYQALKQKPQFDAGLGLMDGGIVDNQGVDSIMEANKRRKDQPFDLIMICDVGGQRMEHWIPEPDKEITGFRTHTVVHLMDAILNFKKWLWLPVLLVLGGIALSSVNGMLWLSGLITGIGVVATVSGLVVRRFLHGMTTSAVTFIRRLPSFASSRLKHFDELPLGLLERMVKERISSAVAMTSEVFMKQLRRFTYYQVYANEDWKFRKASNLIYELSKEYFKVKKEEPEAEQSTHVYPELNDPGEKILSAASIAAKTPTTLWFDAEDIKVDRLNHIIACGQFTTCYNLLRYLEELQKEEIFKPQFESENQDLVILRQSLLEDWKTFKNYPLCLVHDANEIIKT